MLKTAAGSIRTSFRSVLPLLVGLPVLGLFSLSVSNFVEIILITASVNIVLAVSLNVVNGFTGQFSLGHAGFMAVGAYTAAKITTAFQTVDILGLPPGLSDQVVFFFALGAGMVAAASVGFLVGMPSLRLGGDYLAIVTLGFNEITRVTIENTPFLGQATGLAGLPRRTNLVWAGVSVIAVVTMARRLAGSTHGRALFAIREDEVAAEAMGVNTTGYKVRAFMIAAAFAGLSGGLLVHLIQLCTPRSFTFVKSIEVVVMVVLGGLGSVTGSVAAALGLTIALEALREAQQYRMVLYSLLLIALMLTRPSGIFGTREIWHLVRRRSHAKLAKSNVAYPKRGDGSQVQHEVAHETPQPRGTALPALEARKVTMQFGGLAALVDFDLTLASGELVGLIGPNGAGKTTAFNAITGVYVPSQGDVWVGGHRVNGLRPSEICRRGVARTFQNTRLFKELTALDNVRIACHHSSRAGMAAALFRTQAFLEDEARITSRAREFLSVMGLEPQSDSFARGLPYGEQRRLEIARALATGPKVLCLDEPAAGMNASEKRDLMATIRKIRDDFGLAILVIEHDMRLVMGVSERLVVLDHGCIIACGPPDIVRKDPKVIEAYLGDGAVEERPLTASDRPREET
jgi:branched-chain amino acid transport system permease protein